MDTIFVITTIQCSFDCTRTVGWTKSLNEANHIVRSNANNIHEGNNRYCVIEEMLPGIYNCPPKSEYWYVWHGTFDEYYPCDKPEHLKKTCNFGIG